ncbi:MAG TPA: PHB depolymerase family esterase [Gammaproteobacteria bacterium]
MSICVKFPVLFLATVCLLACKASDVKLSENDRMVTVRHGDHERRYLLHVPARHAGQDNLPLILVLHGGGGTVKNMLSHTDSCFSGLADRDGAYIVYPEGVKKQWNDDRPDPISYAHRENIDDSGFIEKIIRTMIRDYRVDPGKVFVTGISNGGMMSFRLAMDLPDMIAAVAPVAASIPAAGKDRISRINSTSLLLLNGTEDPLVPYNGGDIIVFWKNRGKVIPTEDAIDLWKKELECSSGPRATTLSDQDPGDGTRVYRKEYSDCRDNGKVVLYKIEGGGHTWPGGRPNLPERRVGRTSRDISACNVIWGFFKSL